MLVVALDLTGVTIRRGSEIPHAKRTTPGGGAVLVVPAVGVGPGRVMADTEAGRQVREDTPGGPSDPDHRATTPPRNPCGQGCSSYRQFAGPGAVTTSIRPARMLEEQRSASRWRITLTTAASPPR